MTSVRRIGGRRQDFAWLVTIPMAILTAVLAVTMSTEGLAGRLHVALLYLGLFTLAQATVLHFEVRRHSFVLLLTEIPLILALYYLPPLLLITVRVISLLVVQIWQRFPFVKICFNVASVGFSTVVASLIVEAHRPTDVGPRTWLILGGAVAASTAISLAAVIGVITLVQGFPPVRGLVRTATSVAAVAAVNIMVGLVVLLVLASEPWSVLLLCGLGAMLVMVYRSYAQFIGQHRSLSELYELTRAMGDASRDGTLPDVLLGRVRRLLQAECATLWLPAQGRYPELLLSALVDAPGLLDVSKTPPALRAHAVATGTTVAVGPRLGDPKLRHLLNDCGAEDDGGGEGAVKDAIVAPLRSGTAVIGTLEVAGRLGDLPQFGMADVRLLETLSAQVAVAVENSRLVDRLRFDAYHDALTELPNRHRLVALLEEAVKVRAPGEVVAVLLFDIDGLRDVNASLGHDAGDRMIREVAARLRRFAPAAALVGRVGSDEFVVTLRLPSTAEATRLATDLRQALREPLEVGSITLDVDVAVGVAVHPDHGTEAEVLLRRADLAAQAAKQFVTPVHMFNASMQARSSHRLNLAADMRRALEAGEVQVYFQPKVTLSDRRVVGVECLARWEHATHGSVAPTDFVALAEYTGQLGRLTELVLREGLRRAQGWLRDGRPLPVAVNLSTRTLVDPAFPTRLAEMLDEYAVPATLLTLEITEDGMAGAPDRAGPALRRLSEMGVRLAVDDFGTGYSSLSYLRRLPVNEVKIDRSFVQGMATDEGDHAIVRAIVDLAHQFGLVAVAEGVETELTVSLLETLGCDAGQGFLFSRPLPYERLEAWLAVQTGPIVPVESPDGQQHLTARPGDDGEVRRLRAVP